jgi:hypothetical protein
VSDPTPEELRDKIAAERADLGRTASALADRVDVGSRARAAREQATGQVKAGVGQAQEVGREVLSRTAGTAKQAVGTVSGTVDSALHGRDRTPFVAAGAGAALLAVLLFVLRRRRG